METEEKEHSNLRVALTAMMIIFIIGLVLGIFVGQWRMERIAIKHDAAIYHPQTGDFTWKDAME